MDCNLRPGISAILSISDEETSMSSTLRWRSEAAWAWISVWMVPSGRFIPQRLNDRRANWSVLSQPSMAIPRPPFQLLLLSGQLSMLSLKCRRLGAASAMAACNPARASCLLGPRSICSADGKDSSSESRFFRAKGGKGRRKLPPGNSSSQRNRFTVDMGRLMAGKRKRKSPSFSCLGDVAGRPDLNG